MVILVQLVEVDQVGPMAVDESVEAETTLPRAGEIPDIFFLLGIGVLGGMLWLGASLLQF